MFRISARSVLELGSELISTDIIAFYELIKNGFDAGTNNGVEIKFNIILRKNSYLSLKKLSEQNETTFQELYSAIEKALLIGNENLSNQAQLLISKCKTIQELQAALIQIYQLSTIVISDSGSGMSKQDLQENFLVIGTASRKREVDKAINSGATNTPYLGEKGIGRLSAMRLGDFLKVNTATKTDQYLNVLEIDWNRFSDIDAMLDDILVEPGLGGPKMSEAWSGTQIVIGSLSEDWTHERVKKMAEYEFSRLTDPFMDPKQRPRIAIYWNDERVDIPWMKQVLLDHAHAKVIGRYEIIDGQPQLTCTVEAINLGFEHPKEVEKSVLSLVDLESMIIGPTQDIPEHALKSVGAFDFEAYWFNRRRLSAIDGIGDLRAVKELQEKWSGIMLFRDRFRVFPYGDDDDDWLALDRKALRRSGYLLNKDQFVGRVKISRVGNKDLLDQTNREGLRETPEQQVFLEIMKFVIQDRLFQFLRSVERQYKGQKVDLADSKTQVIDLEKRVKVALGQLRRRVEDEDLKDAVEDLQQVFYSFSDFAERSRLRVEEVEVENRQMIEMAGLGMMVEVVAHELARISENALENLNALKGKSVSDEVKMRLESLRAQMKSLSKRIRVLDPLSISGRQRKEVFTLQDIIQETLDAHEGQFNRHGIKLMVNDGSTTVKVSAVKGMLVQILENLISNSKYWMEMRKRHSTQSYIPKILITIYSSPPTIVYEDNGFGIAVENKDKVFQPFFSLKEKKMRRGLGLFIAKECAVYNDGNLILDDYIDPDTGRLHRFIIELPANAAV